MKKLRIPNWIQCVLVVAAMLMLLIVGPYLLMAGWMTYECAVEGSCA